MSAVYADELAARALRDWLLLQLPAKVTAVNLTRAATIRAPYAGPYDIPAASTLPVCIAPDSNTFIPVQLTPGAARTGTEVAADINATGGLSGCGAALSGGGFTVTSSAPPTASAASVVQLQGNPILPTFGFDLGGEKVVATALVAPTSKGICDGLPMQPDFWPSGNAGGSAIVVIIGDRASRPVLPHPRRDEFIVTLDVSILRIEPQQQNHRSREHIHAAVRCVRECLLQDGGKRLGRAEFGDVMYAMETQTRVAAKPFRFTENKDAPVVSPLFDGATMQIEVRVFERPGTT